MYGSHLKMDRQYMDAFRYCEIDASCFIYTDELCLMPRWMEITRLTG